MSAAARIFHYSIEYTAPGDAAKKVVGSRRVKMRGCDGTRGDACPVIYVSVPVLSGTDTGMGGGIEGGEWND